MVVHKKAQRGRGVLVQAGLRLEAEILDRLRSGGRGLSDEIRDRLERTFREDAIDPVTRELRDGLLNIAARLKRDFGTEWHASPTVHQEFVEAIARRLFEYRPERHAGPVAVSDLFEAVLKPDDPPGIIGRMRESDDRREHSYPHLEAVQKRRSTGKLSARHIRAKKGSNDE